MKRLVFKLLLCVSVFFMTISASAQSKEDMLRRRAAQKVGQMCDYIEFMADKAKSIDTRKYYRLIALNLFINKGNAYEEDGRMKEGVLMEITSVNRKKTDHPLIRDYFTNLINLKYEKVVINTTEVADIRVSNLQRIDDNEYVCTCYFEQAFCGYRDGKPIYKDITRKKIKCYVFVEQTEDGEEYIVMLGDVTALGTIPG
ncbi:hypothetical protein [Phocaeicola barnesiae]|uniref:hypothetical protein n=1 Tax=Phocaeicola barnesiae TaxID=376804 RepID=UPI0025A3A6C7|nr:hypothetical protein [Phocaeicola barnesiae]MDM8310277.1 hypothetical protein [Phocaeicola barnesiae]